jgi:hypothetical protein
VKDQQKIKTRSQKKPDLWVRQEGRWSVDGLSMGFRGNQKEREREKKKKKKKAYLHGSMGAQLFCTGGNGEIKRRGERERSYED